MALGTPDEEEAGIGQASPGEEPHARRERVFNLPAVVMAFCAAMAAIHFVRVQILNDDQDFWLLLRAAFIPVIYTGPYAIDGWSFTAPFTYTLLHGDVVHLAVNTVWLAAFGSPLAVRLGVGRFLVFWAATGLAAAGFHFALHPASPAPLIGASGAIAGMMGAAARFGFRTERGERGTFFAGAPLSLVQTFQSRSTLTFLAVWMGVNALTGLAGVVPGVSGQIAWEAHVGGLLAGFLGIGAFLPRQKTRP